MTRRKKSLALLVGILAFGMAVAGVSGAAMAQQATPTPTPTEQPGEQGPPEEAGPPDEQGPPGEAGPPEEPGERAGGADVNIVNQTSNGTAVMVNATELPEGGFAVVYNATLAAPLGHSDYLQPGEQENVTISLNQSLATNETNATMNETNATMNATNATMNETNATMNATNATMNETVIVFAFQDTNDNRQFDLGTDEVYVQNGEPVTGSAHVNVSAGADNITAQPGNVTANETGNVTANETGNVTGNVTDNQTGNATFNGTL